MESTFQLLNRRRFILVSTALGLLVGLLCASGLHAQSPEEHASHHPGQAGVATPAAEAMPADGVSPAPPATPGGVGGMMEGMGEMMKNMGVPPPKALYPSMMDLPDLPPEKRDEVQRAAHERMKSGADLMAEGLDQLVKAAPTTDYAAMQAAVATLREGLARFDSGIAAQRAIAEGKDPRQLATQWFKQQLNLRTPSSSMEHAGPFGLSWSHLVEMGLLIAFAVVMIAMYFFKMRRAAALFRRIDPGSGPPPPGGAPPLAGVPRPSAPAAPPPGGSSSVPVPGRDAANAADKPPTPPVGKGSPPSPSAPPAASGVVDAAKIAGRANQLWQARGRPMGSPKTDWLRAEEELAKAAEKPPALPAVGGSPASPATPPAVSEATTASPVTANWRGQLRVGSIVTETPGVKTFRLLPSSNDRFLPFTFVPGQFLNVAFSIGGARMNRSYSISSSPTPREYVDLTVKREPRGAVSRHIYDLLKVGDLIEAAGPVGKFTFSGAEAESIVLIAAGVGITPMVSITRYLTERAWPGDIFFIYTCRTPADFIFGEEVAALQHRNPKLRVAVTITKAEGTDWKGPRGRITKELLTQTVPNIATRRIHVCGPPAMMEATKAILTELGVSPDQVKSELFGATKPSPAAAGTTAKPTALAAGPLVTFSKNNKSARIHVNQTVLELSEELAIGIENSCRVGTCGVCKVKLTSGEVEMAVEDGLDPDDKANSIILACQAKPKGDIAVEA